MKKLTKKAFSLLELLIAMTILAGLATLAMPNLNLGADSAKKRDMENDMRNTITSIANYQVLEGGLPGEQTFSNGSYLGSKEIKINEDTTIELEHTNDCINGYELTLERAAEEKIVYYDFCVGKVQILDKPPLPAFDVRYSMVTTNSSELTQEQQEELIESIDKFQKMLKWAGIEFSDGEDHEAMDSEEFYEYVRDNVSIVKNTEESAATTYNFKCYQNGTTIERNCTIAQTGEGNGFTSTYR